MNFIKFILIFAYFIIASDLLYAQTDGHKEKILKFLSQEEKKGQEVYEDELVFITHQLLFRQFDGETIGIYSFGLLFGIRPYLLFYDGREVTIKTEYESIEIITDSITFIEKYESSLSTLEKISYLENILRIIKENIQPSGFIPLPPNPDGDN